eukprot:s1313_g7.t1
MAVPAIPAVPVGSAARPSSPRLLLQRSNSPEGYRTLSPSRSLVAVPVATQRSLPRSAIQLAPAVSSVPLAVGPYISSVSRAARAAVTVTPQGAVLTPRGPPAPVLPLGAAVLPRTARQPASAPAAPASPRAKSPQQLTRVLVTNSSGGQLWPSSIERSEDSLARQLRALKEAKQRAASELAKSEKQIAQRQDQLRRETVQALQATPRLADALKRWPSPPPPCAEPRVQELIALSEITNATTPMSQVEEELPGDSSTLLMPLMDTVPSPPVPSPPSPSPLSPPAPPVLLSAANPGVAALAHERVPRKAEEAPAKQSHGSNGVVPARLPRPHDRSSEIQLELKRCRQALQRCVAGVTVSDLRQLRQLRRPPPGVVRTCEFISILLGEKEGKTVNFKKLLADSLATRLAAFEPHSITHAMRAQLRTLGTLTDGGCSACVALTRWCSCIRTYLDDGTRSGSPRRYPGEDGENSENVAPETAPGATVPVNGSASALVVSPELRQLSPEELRRVENLTITRKDVASVMFHGVTDCTDLDLEKDVLLKRGYVLVYPDPVRKPPKGSGLNKRATVTMFQCFPPAQEYKDKIKKMTEENSACRFIDYDCDSGIWRFEVERF